MIVVLINLVRKKKMEEPFCIFWAFVFVAIIIFTFFTRTYYLEDLVSLMGIAYSGNLVFFFGFLVVLTVQIYFTVQMSSVTRKLKAVVQELAMVSSKLEELRSEPREKEKPDSQD